MTVGFAMMLVIPRVEDGDAYARVAQYAYVILVMTGTVNSFLGVWTAGHSVASDCT